MDVTILYGAGISNSYFESKRIGGNDEQNRFITVRSVSTQATSFTVHHVYSCRGVYSCRKSIEKDNLAFVIESREK